jgi:hypothetical protein
MMHVFDYDDFGPQILASGLLGPDCYSFGACCCMERGDSFQVRVVVHRADTERAKVLKRYPSGPEVGDYRLVTSVDARAYLLRNLAELRTDKGEDRIPALEARLGATLARLDALFPKEPTRGDKAGARTD